MTRIAAKVHLPDKEALARANRLFMLGMIGGGLSACALGACVYDVGRLFFP